MVAGVVALMGVSVGPQMLCPLLGALIAYVDEAAYSPLSEDFIKTVLFPALLTAVENLCSEDMKISDIETFGDKIADLMCLSVRPHKRGFQFFSWFNFYLLSSVR
jgi:hypothetical protein